MSDEKKADGNVTLELGPNDGAILLYADGRRELVLPAGAATGATPSRETLDALAAMVVLGDRPLYAAAMCIVNDEAKNYAKMLDKDNPPTEPESDPNDDPLN
jgi:hypothetical protein